MDGGSGLVAKAKPKIKTGLAPVVDNSAILPAAQDDQLNYTATKDPNVLIGKHGAVITRQQYLASLQDPQNNMKFNTFEDYAHWLGGWAKAPGTTVISAQKPVGTGLDMSDKARGYSSNYYPPNH